MAESDSKIPSAAVQPMPYWRMQGAMTTKDDNLKRQAETLFGPQTLEGNVADDEGQHRAAGCPRRFSAQWSMAPVVNNFKRVLEKPRYP